MSLGIPNVYKRVEIMSKRDEDILLFIFIFSRSLILREIPECDSGFFFLLLSHASGNLLDLLFGVGVVFFKPGMTWP